MRKRIDTACCRRAPWTACVGLGLIATLCSGCQTGGIGPLSRWRMARDGSLTTGLKGVDADDGRSMMARWLNPKSVKPSDPNAPSKLVLGPKGWSATKVAPDPQADAEFADAEKLFQQGKLDEAEPAFARIAKARKDTPWGEKAQFYLAETRFQRGRYARAHDSYEELLATYPGTQYLEKAVAREYTIAHKWLDLYNPNVKDSEKISWTGRFTGERPLLDTNGHALSALEHVRHHDPNGPLADDAVLEIADFHFKHQDYESSALYYDQLTNDHPKSPFVMRAQLASIDSKMKGYIGPEYDGEGLEQARETVKRTLTNFPERDADTAQALYHTLALISDQQAERAYNVAQYYLKIKKVPSAEYYFAMIPHRWPDSPWAAKAKKELALLAKMPRTESLPSKIMSAPGSVDPFSSAVSGGTGMGGMGMPSGGGMGMGGMGMGMPGAGMY